MKTVKVIFKNSAHNYSTSVSKNSTDAMLKNYFIGTLFNVGVYPKEDMQKCIEIEITGNNYETGASTHAVNDLILFTDNTRELAEMRDTIYKDILQAGFFGTKPKHEKFECLERAARKRYIKELNAFSITRGEIIEFCQLYLKGFERWKEEQENEV